MKIGTAEKRSPQRRAIAKGPHLLLEREGEMSAFTAALDRAAEGIGEGALLIEGQPGIGKSTLLIEFAARARHRGFRVLVARGTELEREFGFGVVRQLLGEIVWGMDEEERKRRFSGPAAFAAPVFGLEDGVELAAVAGEAPLLGLLRLTAALAEEQPIVILIDDAHWADAASLRFVHYLGQRAEGLPVLTVVAARPSEPGAEGRLGEVAEWLAPRTIRPAPLSEAGTVTLVRSRLNRRTPWEVGAACHRVSGGVPLLVEEILLSGGDIESAASPELGRSALERARRLDPAAVDLLRAVSVLGDGASVTLAAALSGLSLERAGTLADDLASVSILADGPTLRFAHPLTRTSVYEAIPAASRSLDHARAAELLRARGGMPEAIAGHLLRTEPGDATDAAEVLERAAVAAAARGAPESAAAYLRRALAEPVGTDLRARLLQRLAAAEMALRDPAALGHLEEAAAIVTDSELAVQLAIQLADSRALAGEWEAIGAALDIGLSASGPETPGRLHLEAYRAAHRAYDPAQVRDFDADLPRLRGLVAGRADAESRQLRWLLAGTGSIRDADASEVVELVVPSDGSEILGAGDGWESPLATQAALALLVVDALPEAHRFAAELRREGLARGALMALVAGGGFAAALNAREGRLDAAEADVRIALEMLDESDVGLVALTTFLYYCVDPLIERSGLDDLAGLVLAMRIPPGFGRMMNGALTLETQAALMLARGDREGAAAAMLQAEPIHRALGTGPRLGPWRSRLALTLPESEADRADELAREELELARAVGSAQAVCVALRTRGVLAGGEEGIALLEESAEALAGAGRSLELARSHAELGAALRRGNRRAEAREHLRAGLETAQRVGAERLEERILDELRVAGARPRRRSLSGAGALTPAELRVCTAAAAGGTNREIAQDLFVSLRTVEMHLTNAYRKLGISGRAGLADAIRDEA